MAPLLATTVAADSRTRAVEAVHGRIRGAATDPGVRARVRRALGSADLAPEGLPPDAILLVRHVALQLPAQALASGTVRSGDLLWQREGRDRLARSLARAARPNVGRIVPSADAVLFADLSELLACLTLDLSRGRAGERWWWEAWARTGGGTRSVLDALGHDVTLLPPVLDTLASWGAATEVLSSLTSAAAERLLRRLAETFGLPVPEDVADVGDAGPTAAVPDVRGVAPGTARPGSADDPSAAELQPPWSSALGYGTVPAHLPPEQAALLATALLLVRAPRVLTTPGMRAVLRAPGQPWTATGTAGPSDATGDTHHASSGRRAPPSSVAEVRHAVPIASAGGAAAGTPLPAPHADPDRAEDHPASTSDPTVRTVGVGPELGGRRAGAAEAREQGPHARVAAHPVERGSSTPREIPDDRPDGSRPRGGVTTQLGGVCYLANVLRPLQIDTVGDAAWLLEDLTGWALIELLARGLLDDADPEDLPLIARDPLWSLLAELDGRSPGEPLGSREARRGAAIPDVWLQDAVAHGADLAATVPLGPLVRRGVASGTAEGLSAALPYVRWRLRDALGGADVIDVLRVPGRVLVTRTHVDVEIAMDRISIAARLAGLDRDPGWVPRLGRVVSFHFVEEAPS